MAKDVIMPVLGMNQETGTLVEWLRAEGDEVTKGEPLMIVATDKTEVEIEATGSGVLANVSVQPGGEVAVGSAIAIILAPGETAPPLPGSVEDAAATTDTQPVAPAAGSATVAVSPVAARIGAEHNVDMAAVQAHGKRIHKSDVLAHISAQATTPPNQFGRTLASPKARRLAAEEGLDLQAIAGSGPEGAVLAADVLYAAATAATMGRPSAEAVSALAHTSAQPMSRAWKVMAQRLQESWQTVPHFYLERTVNARALLAWHKQAQQESEQKITLTDLLVKVVGVALREHPRLNASWIDEQIVLNPYSNVGLAVAVEDGLLVPVVHGAEALGVVAIAQRRDAVVTSALEGTLALADMQDGTFTISNLGMFGVEKFNAIVNPPQAAILAVGAIEERIVAIKAKAKVRPMLTLTLSCDHRVVDGARGAQFMQTLVDYLEEPLRLLT